MVSKEQIVAAGKVNVAEFFLTPEHSWAPTACIIAYYVSDDGEVISDDLCIPVQLVFKNQVSLCASTSSHTNGVLFCFETIHKKGSINKYKSNKHSM